MTTTVPGHDAWDSGEHYEQFMGRWSTKVAVLFLEWLPISRHSSWLDVGCGSGALSARIVTQCAPARLTAVDQSLPFVAALLGRLGDGVSALVGSALALPMATNSVDATVSGLMLNFIPDPQKALAEMVRVTKPGGCVAVYVWDYAGSIEFLSAFWAAATELDSAASGLDERNRFAGMAADGLHRHFEHAGFINVQSTPLVIKTTFADFDDYWRPFLGGQGPAPTYVQSLDVTHKAALRTNLRSRLPFQEDGSIPMTARAWAIQGFVRTQVAS